MQLRRGHTLQHLLFALLDHRCGCPAMCLRLIRVLLLDKAPHLANLRYFGGFVSTTLSSQLKTVVALSSQQAPSTSAALLLWVAFAMLFSTSTFHLTST